MENICAKKDGVKCPLNIAESTRGKYKGTDTNGHFSMHLSQIHLQRHPVYKFWCNFFVDLRHNYDFIQSQ